MSTAVSAITRWQPSCTLSPERNGTRPHRPRPPRASTNMAAELTGRRVAEGAQPLADTSTRGPANRLVLAHIWVAVIAFGVAAAMAMMQAISRANLEVPYRSASMYYMSVTAHGVLMALVFT